MFKNIFEWKIRNLKIREHFDVCTYCVTYILQLQSLRLLIFNSMIQNSINKKSLLFIINGAELLKLIKIKQWLKTRRN